jgi:hypothetical protein
MRGRQRRFVIGAVGAWIAARVASLWSWGGLTLGLGVAAGVAVIGGGLLTWPRQQPAYVFVPERVGRAPSHRRAPTEPPMMRGELVAGTPWTDVRRAPELLSMAVDHIYGGTMQAMMRHATYAASATPSEPDAIPFVPVRPPAPKRSRWTLSAYLFARPGEGASLASGGALGGSQAAARITYQLNGDGPVRTAAVARFYTPLHVKGAEAALGFDWHPLSRVPLRLSVERRIALDDAGCNAWSAYAAGGFYTEVLRRALVADGYAQAGVVGAHRGDLFVDGALRAGHRIALGKSALTIGGGLWGAAQPGVSRLDAGPRAALVLPVATHSISAALEGRFRIAGRASPGSGVALTLGVDF